MTDVSPGAPAPVVLITGATKGIGWATAQRLAAAGAQVVIGARDRSRGGSAAGRLREAGLDAREVLLDVTDLDSVKQAAGWLEETFGRLDVLVNNAGVLLDQGTPIAEATAAQLRETYETNVFGVVTVTAALLPLLRRGRNPRILNVTSGLGSLTLNTQQYERLADFQSLAYGSSKAALNALTVLYANALRAEGIAVNAVEPGFVATDLNGHAGPGRVEDAAELVAQVLDLDVTGTWQSARGPLPW